MAGGQLAVAYMTDADLPELRQARNADGWWQLLHDTCLTRSRACGYRLTAAPRVLAASSARLTTIVGEAWLAVGRMWAESPGEGRGTSIKVWLPAA